MMKPGQSGRSGPRDAIAERAAGFYERRHFEQWSRDDQAELDTWLAESTLHRVAYLRIKGAAAYADRLVGGRAPEGNLRPAIFKPRAADRRSYRRLAIPMLAAASVALFAAFGWPVVNSLLEPPVRSLSTDVGGRNLLRFADGTEFELNTDSDIRYRMTNHQRTVWLDKGEVWFRVAHDPKNPFAVIIGKHQVNDLGTEFLVRREPKRVEVALLAGAASLATEGIQTIALRPGDDAVASSVSVAVTRNTPQQLADKLAWRNGMLVFRNARLADVVREFNRYNATKLVIADPSIAGVKVSADLKADGLQEFVRLTEDMLNLRADRKGDEILFSRRTPDETKRNANARRGQ